jgi:hypothetical protein
MILFVLHSQFEVIDLEVDRRFVVFMKTVALLFDVEAVSADLFDEKAFEEDDFFRTLRVGGKRGDERRGAEKKEKKRKKTFRAVRRASCGSAASPKRKDWR